MTFQKLLAVGCCWGAFCVRRRPIRFRLGDDICSGSMLRREHQKLALQCWRAACSAPEDDREGAVIGQRRRVRLD